VDGKLKEHMLNPFYAETSFRKVSSYAACSSEDGDSRRLETLTMLLQAQEDISSTDISHIFSKCHCQDTGPLDILLKLDNVQDWLVRGDITYPALGAALRMYGCFILWESELSQLAGYRDVWELMIRRLLRMGVNVHAAIPRNPDRKYGWGDLAIQDNLSEFGTPLDELFTHAEDIYDIEGLVRSWLRILAMEGYDVEAYLKRERDLRPRELPRILPYNAFDNKSNKWFYLGFVFRLGENPMVFADWRIDPDSSIVLAQKEFKDLIFPEPNLYEFAWEPSWPFFYPKWSDKMECYVAEWESRRDRADRRANRRWEKKARKAAGRNGTRAHTSMPGAWPV